MIHTINPAEKMHKSDDEIIVDALAAHFTSQTRVVAKLANRNMLAAAQDEHDFAGRILQVWTKREGMQW